LGGDFLNKWYRSVIKIQIQNSIIDQFAKRREEKMEEEPITYTLRSCRIGFPNLAHKPTSSHL